MPKIGDLSSSELSINEKTMGEHEENGKSIGTAELPRHAVDRRTTGEKMTRFLKEWFDPRPQIKEMCQVVFWKDMLIEAMALGQILVAVIFLLNTLHAVEQC